MMNDNFDNSAFECPLCSLRFDNQERLPRLIPNCGHTICSICLENLIQNTPEANSFTCPEDGEEIPLPRKDINLFPKNVAFIRLIEKKRLSLQCEEKLLINDLITSSSEFLLEKLEDPIRLNSPEKEEEKQDKKFDKKEKVEKVERAEKIENHQRLCPEHHRPLEVVCIDHQTRICTNCALFGMHKNHNIKPEQEVLIEITNRAESLCSLFQQINQNQKNFESEEYFNSYKMKVKEKEYDIFESVNKKFEEIYQKIKRQQEKFNIELHNKFEDLLERFKTLSIPRNEIFEKIKNWKTTASNSINSLNLHEIAFDLLPNYGAPQNDLIKKGEHLLCEQELMKERNNNLLSECLKNIKLTIRDSYLNFLDGFCTLECSLPADSITLWNSVGSKSLKANFFNNVSIVKKSPPKSQDYSSDFQLKKTEDSLSIKPEINRKDLKHSFPKLEDVENDLLNLDLNNFTLTELAEFNINNTFNKILSDNSIVSSNSNHNNHSHSGQNNNSNFGNLTPIRTHETPKVLTESIFNNYNNQNTSNGQISINAEKRSSTPITDRRLFVNGENTSKNLKKKVGGFKIGEKYEAILEGLKKDCVEIADFTGAEIGDVGVNAICEYVKVSKNIKSLKLLKNKITNEGLPILLKALMTNTSLASLNLAQNLLTDKCLDIFASYFQTNRNIKLLCLNQNNINLRNAKNKVADFKKMGINISI